MRKKFVFSLLSLLSFSFIFSSCDKEEETQLSSSHLLLTTYICETSDENSYPPEYTDEKLIEPEPNSNIELPPETTLEEWTCYHNNYQTNLKNIPTEETTGLLEFTCLDCGYNKNHILDCLPNFNIDTGIVSSYLLVDYKAPTCIEDGFMTIDYYYSVEVNKENCDLEWMAGTFIETFTIYLAPLEHNYVLLEEYIEVEYVNEDPLDAEYHPAVDTKNIYINYKSSDLTYVCSNCNDFYTISRCEVYGHEYSTEYYYDENNHFYKSLCDHEDKEVSPHEYIYEDGFDYCITCDYVKEHEHIYNEEIEVTSTCTEEGYTYQQCEVCAYKNIYDYKQTIAHNYQKEVVLSTCTNQGYDLYTCSECDHFYKEGYVDSLDHLYTKWFIYQKPTFTSEGILRQVCMNDSSHYIELIIPSLSSDDYDIKVTDELTSDNLSIAICTYRYEEQTFTFIVYIENKED